MSHYKVLAPGAESVESDDSDTQAIVSSLPAQPSTYLVYAHSDGSTFRTHVLGWGVLSDGSLVPLAMHGVWGGTEDENVFVLHPDGRASTLDQNWESEAEAVEELKKFDR